ncbi:hypothetical protein [Tautonia sociabilis]|uniref:Uncharacterized protein n=1 Tax=Tautonia sociabilis TaxID=2080755 RepID=A0A432MEK9_9BACT|nr:hypothetical protein [Tautonia sociabilis]RUL83948.1 hypothetical protein TsocGM_21235 [Tautonia sociabilis]
MSLEVDKEGRPEPGSPTRTRGGIRGRATRAVRSLRRSLGRLSPTRAPSTPGDSAEVIRLEDEVRELAGQVAYLAAFGVGFGVALPAAALGRASTRLPDPARRGLRAGARDARRDAEEFLAGWSEAVGRAGGGSGAGGRDGSPVPGAVG